MPCYDPPPPWEGAQRANALQATQLLCAHIKEQLDNNNGIAVIDFLQWFADHREIDRQIATTFYFGNPNPEEASKAKQDIARAKRLLKLFKVNK